MAASQPVAASASVLNPRAKFNADIRQAFIEFDFLDNKYSERDLFCTQTSLKGQKRNLLDKLRDVFFKTVLFGWRADPNCWYDRLWAWEKHIDAYLQIQENCTQNSITQYTVETVGVERIKCVAELMKPLDSRFSMLLAVNSVLAGFVGLSVKETYDLFAHAEIWESIIWKWSFLFAMFLALSALTCLSLFNIWFGMRGFRRVVWGDLSRTSNLVDAELQHSRFLIISLARRTNMFRIVSESTRWSLVIFMMFVLIAAIALGHVLYQPLFTDFFLSFPPPPTPHPPLPPL